MTKPERDELRFLQDDWLALKSVRWQIMAFGDDEVIAMGFHGSPWPTYRDVRTMLLPDLKTWFEDFFRGDS